MMKWLRRGALAIAALALTVLGAGALYEALGRAHAAKAFPPPGRMVDIGGRRIQLDCRGAGAPIVVFESGLDGLGSLSWSAVQNDVAKFTRACAYSRAGLIWSDDAGRPFAAANVAEDLHRALAAAGEKPPYVLVAHSLGGPYSLVFTGRYGADVAGLVFVDASHPDQLARLRAAAGKDLNQGAAQEQIGDALAWTGLVRLMTSNGQLVPATAPAWIDAPNRAFLPRSLHAIVAEQDALAATLALAGRSRSLGDRPLVVLTHGAATSAANQKAAGLTPAAADRVDVAWLAMQNDEAAWSSRSRHQVVAGATHYIQFDRPQAVVAAARDVVDQVRSEPAARTP